MMENESLREPRNTPVMLLSFAVVAVLIWAIIAQATVSKRNKELGIVVAEKQALQVEAEQKIADMQRKVDEAEKTRLVALEWTRQHQLRIQEEMRKKEEAAKLAKEKADASKKTSVKSTGKTGTKTSGTKKPVVKKTTKTTHS